MRVGCLKCLLTKWNMGPNPPFSVYHWKGKLQDGPCAVLTLSWCQTADSFSDPGEAMSGNAIWGGSLTICSRRCYSGVSFIVSVLLLLQCTATRAATRHHKSMRLNVEIFTDMICLGSNSLFLQWLSVWLRNLRPWFMVGWDAQVLHWVGTSSGFPKLKLWTSATAEWVWAWIS